MAKRTVTQPVDDLDGSPATVTHKVALDGRRVRVDLSPANAHDVLLGWRAAVLAAGTT